MSISKPAKLLSLPFANNTALRNNIPINSASPLASYYDGFPQANMLPITAGGVPPEGQDFNGIFYEHSAHIVWINAGGQYTFDAAFAALIGGYPAGVVLQNNSGLGSYINVLDGNTTDFNSTPASIGVSWMPYAGSALQLQGTIWCGTSGGSANAQTFTPVPAISAYNPGLSLSGIAGFTNTGALTINVSGIGAVHVKKDSPTGPIELTSGEWVAGNIISIKFDGTSFQLVATELGTASLLNASDKLGSVSAIQVFAGNPNGFVAGNAATGTLAPSQVWDTVAQAFWTCLTTGSTSTATWTRQGSVAGQIGYVSVLSTILPGLWNVDSSAGAFTLTGESSPTTGDNYVLEDFNGSWGVSPVTFVLGSQTFLLNVAYAKVTFVYKSGTWSIQ